MEGPGCGEKGGNAPALDAPSDGSQIDGTMSRPSVSFLPVAGRRRGRWRRWFLVAGLTALALVGTAVGLLRGSLARLKGNAGLPGLGARVTVERDALGVVTLTASDRLDATRALGFVHAQERFFQMDQLRRAGAGELAALFGPAVLSLDRRVRLHRPRENFRMTWAELPADQRATLEAYAAGVNEGLRSLSVSPPEYLLLRAEPEPWLPEDSLAVNLAMRFVLEDAYGDHEIRRALLRRLLPDAAFAFFGAPDSGWDAALDGSELPLPPVPAATEFSWKGWSNRLAGVTSPAPSAEPEAGVPGSNSWAVDGRVAGTGSGILANDMHLALGVPGVWFRARLRYADPRVGARDVCGFTLPGAPAVVVGSNGEIAWGFTSAGMDQCDLVELETDPEKPRRYRTPDGWEETMAATEQIDVRGQPAVPLALELTRWGPVIEPPGLGARFALSWSARLPAGNNLRLLELECVATAGQALDVAPGCGIANNNFVVADRAGDIGWTLVGRLPDRSGFRGDLPVSWADGVRGWNGLLAPERYPRVLHPAGGRLWTANSRVLGSADYLGRSGPVLNVSGARARQIRDDLRARDRLSEAEVWEPYHDDRALYLEPWQRRLLVTLERGIATNVVWHQALDRVRDWGGRAAADSVGYRLVTGFQRNVAALVFEPLVQAGQALNPGFRFGHATVLERLVEERPPHLLNPRFASYEELFAVAAGQVFASLAEQGVPLAKATWGDRNRLDLRHPLTRAVPALSRWLNVPRVPMDGAPADMPKIQGADFGPSERMVVSPGREESGLCNQPAGQSGHFLSPFYRAGHDAWVAARPLPFLPGPTEHRLELLPASR